MSLPKLTPIPRNLIIKEDEHWIVNHRVGSNLPGYLMIGSRMETTNIHELSPVALAELGSLLALVQQALLDLFGPEHIYVGRYGHTEGHSIHFHVIPIYSWVKEAFATDALYRVLRSFYTPGVPTSDPDGGELTLFVWREFCESKTPPAVHGPSVAEAIALLKEKLNVLPSVATEGRKPFSYVAVVALLRENNPVKIRDIFDACALVYDQDRPKLIPCFDLFYGTLLRQIPFPHDAPIRVLDLGAGTGLVSSFIGKQFPNATFLLIDIAEKMLAVAQDRFKDSDRHEFRVIDSRKIICVETYDVIVSALSIHHLDDEDKKAVYAKIFTALKPGGVFLHSEQVRGPTPELEALYQKNWVDGIRASGLPEDRVQAALVRVREDLNAPLADQLDWLRGIGFQDVDCWFKYYRFAVFGGRK